MIQENEPTKLIRPVPDRCRTRRPKFPAAGKPQLMTGTQAGAGLDVRGNVHHVVAEAVRAVAGTDAERVAEMDDVENRPLSRVPLTRSPVVRRVASLDREALARLDVVIGEWAVEATFPAGRTAPAGGTGGGVLARSRFDWALDRQFLLQRTSASPARSARTATPSSAPGRSASRPATGSTTSTSSIARWAYLTCSDASADLEGGQQYQDQGRGAEQAVCRDDGNGQVSLRGRRPAGPR
jgi:hypothetical protein